MPRSRFSTVLLVAVPLLLAVAVYGRVLHGELLYDDVRSVRDNPAVTDLGGTVAGFGRALLQGGRPTTDLTLAVDRAVGGSGTFAFHVTNLLLHLAATLLVLVFTRAVLRLAGSGAVDGVAVAVAGLFALHPLQTEAVSYVTQRAEVLASAFYLATLLALLRADRAGPRAPGLGFGALALLLFALGMGAKPILVTAPVAFLLLLASVPGGEAPRRKPWAWRLALVAPLVLVALAAARGTLRSVEGKADAGFSIPRSDPGSYLLTEWRAVVTYLRLLVWPAGQSADWSFPLSRNLSEPPVLLAGLFLAALLVAAAVLGWRCRGRPGSAAADGRVAAYGTAWFFLVLAPTSSFIPIADVLVEHRVYLASWGFLVVAVLGGRHLLARLVPGREARVGMILVGLAWGVLAVVAWQRNAVWESELALWSDAVAKAPGKARPRLGLGTALARRGDLPGAIAQLRAGLELAPLDATGLRVALLHDLGTALLSAGRTEEAIAPLREAVRLDPAEQDPPQSLALALWTVGDAEGAEEAARAALARNPASAGGARVLGEVLASRGDRAGAVPLLEQAVRAQPGDATVRFNLGVAYASLGRIAEACASFRAVTRLRAPPEALQAAQQGIAALGCPP